MGEKKWVEVCLISGRGLRRSSSLWKLQWYAVGWIHPDNKYCTKIDTSGTSNPLWKTGFSTSLEFEPDLALHVQVYSRDPIFLRETRYGSATVFLKEFFDKYTSDSAVDEVGSFQLRKNNSSKHLGFVDVSIRISQDRDNPASSYLGADEGFNLDNLDGGIKDVSLQPSKHDLALPKSQQTQNYSHQPPAASYQPQPPPPPPSNMGYISNFLPPNYSHHPPAASGASYQSRPPPPPAPSNVGYIPNFVPTTSNYVNMPTVAAARGVGPGFGMGVGAGALAAGAVIFGDDIMSSASRDATDIMSTYPPF